MTNLKYCSQCGAQLKSNTKFCTQCGTRSQSDSSSSTETASNKSAVTALLLCLFLGGLGAHRFYVGKIKTGILMLLTGGGLGIWSLIDLIRIACCEFTDRDGNYLIFTKGRPRSFRLVVIILSSIIGFVLINIILLISLIFYFTSPITNTIREQLTALHANDMNKAYSYLANETTATISVNDFEKYIAAHPAITHYKSISIPERKIENSKGFATVTLRGENDKETTVEYALVKENNAWKILSFRVNDTRSEVGQDNTSAKIFTNTTDHYSIQYPGNWNYKKSGEHTVLFEGQPGSRSHYSSIIITVFPAGTVKIFKNVDAAADALKKQIIKLRPDAQFSNSGEVELPTNPKGIHGKLFVVTYTIKGHAVKHMQFLLSREGSNTIYSWIYISPVVQYDNDLPIAKAMYESWKIE